MRPGHLRARRSRARKANAPMSDDTIADLCRRADEDYHAGRFDECISRMRRLVQEYREDGGAHRHLAWVLGSLEEWDGSIAEYREAIRINPQDIVARANLAGALSESGDGERAIIECMEALRREPNNSYVHQCLGLIFFRLDMCDAALSEFDEGLRLDVTGEDHRAVQFGICITLFKKALLSRRRPGWLHPACITPFAPRPATPGTRSEWLAALQALEDYESSYPGDAEVLTMIGRVLWVLGEKNAAVETLWRTFETDPADFESLPYLARALFVLGRWKSFWRVFRRAVENANPDPRYKQEKRALRWLNRPPSG